MQKCRWTLEATNKDLIKGDFNAFPYKIYEEAVRYLMDVYWNNLLHTTKKGYIIYLQDASCSTTMTRSKG